MFYYTNLTNPELSKPLLKLFRREKSARNAKNSGTRESFVPWVTKLVMELRRSSLTFVLT